MKRIIEDIVDQREHITLHTGFTIKEGRLIDCNGWSVDDHRFDKYNIKSICLHDDDNTHIYLTDSKGE